MPMTPRDTGNQGFETAISHLVSGLVAYANVYQERYRVPVSADPCLGVDWLNIARGLRGLRRFEF